MGIFGFFKSKHKYLGSGITATKIRQLSFDKFSELCTEVLLSDGWEFTGENRNDVGGFSVPMEKKESSAVLYVREYDKSPIRLKSLKYMYEANLQSYPESIFYIITQNRFDSECFEDKCASLIHRKEVVLVDAEHLAMILRKK